ncbi:hypothetical protein [Mesoflavibacter zeaxanthinifaciens]|uniref:hypothetical protein n=1 Tax=Mesoflavibacter zeaxanthinifaciens TaxID=393060 RepID=UPI0026EF458C|nr:hypothetical protein [Mesoflavibacter zeaxanthinifaciens]
MEFLCLLITKILMKYVEVKKFLKLINKSKSTLYRFYRKNEDLSNETKKKRHKRMIPEIHAKYFNSELMHEENKVLCQKNQSMRNLIDCLVDKESLQARLWYMDWSYFITVAYKSERNKKSCFKMMHGCYYYLIDKYGTETDIRLFFTTEPFVNRKGYHNHFALYVSNAKLHDEVVKAVQSYFSFDRVDYGKYDRYQAGLFYMSKEGLVGEDWDILGNNLSE